MLRKGVLKGDNTFRKFTFDDEKCVNGKYECTYPTNPLEKNEFSEPEVIWFRESEIIPIGGWKKPQVQKPVEQPVEQVQQVPVEKKKPGRPKKVQNVEQSPLSGPSVPSGSSLYEYYVEEIHSDGAGELQNKLNELGSQGWEMCGFDMNKSLFKDIHIIAVFKRKRG